jgi:SAM-dependent methyltransferase
MNFDAQAFIDFERSAHDRIAESYGRHFAPLTALAVGVLLDTVRLTKGQSLLDVATGPGVAAAAAQARGARVTGVDISAGMIALASRANPDIVFRVAEVTNLPFPDSAFDAVICNFALGHFPDPACALTECGRVLAPGGTLAFSWWDLPSRQRVQGLFREVIAELALPPHPDVPSGHDTLRFSEPDRFAGLLNDCGLRTVKVTAHQTTYPMAGPDELWEAGIGGMAVTAGAIAAQPPAIQRRARDVLARRAEVYRTAIGLEIPIAFLIGAGQKYEQVAADST